MAAKRQTCEKFYIAARWNIGKTDRTAVIKEILGDLSKKISKIFWIKILSLKLD